jgi:hypothetical protein
VCIYLRSGIQHDFYTTGTGYPSGASPFCLVLFNLDFSLQCFVDHCPVVRVPLPVRRFTGSDYPFGIFIFVL